MRTGLLALIAAVWLIAGRNPESSFDPLQAIEEFDALIQKRLARPQPESLGMTRIMVRPSFGHHFQPVVSHKRDFAPENGDERHVVAKLEQERVELGLYLFGASIESRPASDLSFRTLKGPGIITAGTLRPFWYPGLDGSTRALLPAGRSEPEALPDWGQIYPLAQRAMRSFRDGGRGFETTHGTWQIAARPTMATDQKCISCHNHLAQRPKREFRVGDPLGGILYAFRIKANPE